MVLLKDRKINEYQNRLQQGGGMGLKRIKKQSGSGHKPPGMAEHFNGT
jgi:hypothetical protein